MSWRLSSAVKAILDKGGDFTGVTPNGTIYNIVTFCKDFFI